MSDSILVISFKFPPMKGVGGRRWSKFAKHLARKDDLNLTVLSAGDNLSQIRKRMVSVSEHQNFEHIQLPLNYPKNLAFLEFANPTLWQRISFRYELFFLKRKVSGNYWDFSVLWEGYFKEIIPEIIKAKKVSKVVISGPPYRYVKYALGLKELFSDIELILDYRDPWNDINDPLDITKKRLAFEKDLEREVLKKVDKIITVSDFQKEAILNGHPDAAPVYVLPNGFDLEDYDNCILPQKDKEGIRIAHFGTLHYLKDYYWKPFFNALNRLKVEDPTFYKTITIDLIGYCPPEVKSYLNEIGVEVNRYGVLDECEAYVKLSKADIGLWFKYDGSSGDFATKFGDYISLKKFMWTFSKKGTVTQHIEENEIGKVFYRKDTSLEDTVFNALKDLKMKERIVFNPDYDTSKLKVDNLTDNLLEIIEIKKAI